MSEPRRRKRLSRNPESEVGYCRPPRDQQFGSPTRTGPVNTKGRPKKKKAPPTLDDELGKKVTVVQGGKRQKYTAREAVFKRLVQRALEGDFRAMKLVMEYDARRPEEGEDVDPFGLDPKLMEEMLKQYEEEITSRARKGRPRAPDQEGRDD